MEKDFEPLGPADLARLKPLAKRSDALGLRQLASHGLAIAISSVLIGLSLGSLWVWPAMVLQGLFLVFLFAAAHESIHRTAFKTRWINDWVAAVSGFVLVLPPKYFRLFHFAHHRYTQDPGRDPELGFPKPQSLGAYLLMASGLVIWVKQTQTLFRHALGQVDEDFIPAGQRPEIIAEARLYLVAYSLAALLSLLSGSAVLLFVWVLPMILGQPFLRLYLLAEHVDCPLVPDMLRNTRTIYSIAPVRWLAWNMPYHTAHHAYPALPFHSLAEATGLLEDRIVVKAKGYVAVQKGVLNNFKQHTKNPV